MRHAQTHRGARCPHLRRRGRGARRAVVHHGSPQTGAILPPVKRAADAHVSPSSPSPAPPTRLVAATARPHRRRRRRGARSGARRPRRGHPSSRSARPVAGLTHSVRGGDAEAGPRRRDLREPRAVSPAMTRGSPAMQARVGCDRPSTAKPHVAASPRPTSSIRSSSRSRLRGARGRVGVSRSRRRRGRSRRTRGRHRRRPRVHTGPGGSRSPRSRQSVPLVLGVQRARSRHPSRSRSDARGRPPSRRDARPARRRRHVSVLRHWVPRSPVDRRARRQRRCAIRSSASPTAAIAAAHASENGDRDESGRGARRIQGGSGDHPSDRHAERTIAAVG